MQLDRQIVRECQAHTKYKHQEMLANQNPEQKWKWLSSNNNGSVWGGVICVDWQSLVISKYYIGISSEIIVVGE